MNTKMRLREVGITYGGLTGKTKRDFGHGAGRFVTFNGLMAAPRLRSASSALSPVDVRQGESQNRVIRGDILFNGTSETPEEIAFATVVECDLPPDTFLNSFCFGYRLRTDYEVVDPTYLAYLFRAPKGRALVAQLAQGFTRFNISKVKLLDVEIDFPALVEQRRIAKLLMDADSQVDARQRLLAKQVDIATGVRESLLTGHTRLPGFRDEWNHVTVGDLMFPRSERNSVGEALEVLSCTKDRGFVRSLDYFKTQVFSRNLAGYLVIHKGDIGYPSNHVEEGSIGVQELAERGLVSPIYVVMGPRTEKVDSFFLHRLLKLSSFRREFVKVTNASVNRRGSLRWPEFSQLKVRVPSKLEQQAIAHTIRDFERDVLLSERLVRKARSLRAGLMQELLPGPAARIAS